MLCQEKKKTKRPFLLKMIKEEMRLQGFNPVFVTDELSSPHFPSCHVVMLKYILAFSMQTFKNKRSKTAQHITLHLIGVLSLCAGVACCVSVDRVTDCWFELCRFMKQALHLGVVQYFW